MKWTANNDQLLFMKLIETHDVSIKAEKIREAWPKDQEVPTTRAISERIAKIRNAVKASGSAPATPRKRKGSEPVPGTPKTPKVRKIALGVDDKLESQAGRGKKLAAETGAREGLDRGDLSA